MKHLAKRCLSLLIVLALCLSMLPAIAPTADAVTSTTEYVKNSQGYIYNWGKRGETATYLSPNAEAYYAKNNVTYASLSALAGSSNVSTVHNSALYQKLHDIMESTHKYKTNYDATKELYQYTDCQESGKGATGKAISSYYSGIAIGPSWDGAWNREHTWPNSKGKGGSDENDLMMLRPTASSENSSRGNNAYGTSSGYYNPNSASSGKYDLRGDVVRTALGHYVRWEMHSYTLDNGAASTLFGTNGMLESKALMLEWLAADPVDTWEMGRNDSAESILGYRNVFIDYPELAFVLFGEAVPEHTTPSGEAAASAFKITTAVNNAAYGSVTLSGKTITAIPATGYEVAGYTVTAGTATVTRSGNTFVVNATSDCTVQINFQARQAIKMRTIENGVITAELSYYMDDLVQLPAPKNEAPEGYTFLGWSTMTIAETSTKPSFYTVGSNFTLGGLMNEFHAVYSRVVVDPDVESNMFQRYTGPMTPGDYVILSNYGAMQAAVSSDRFAITTGLTFADDNVAIISPEEVLIWTVAADGTYFTLYNELKSLYAAGTGASNKVMLVTDPSTYARWTVTENEGMYVFENVGNKNNGANYTLRRNANYGFACYAASTGTGIELYKRAAGVVYYSTTAVACEHANTEPVAAVPPTCTEGGYTEGVRCTDCSKIISGYAVVEPLGHDYDETVTPPTETEEGYTTFTCNTCGDTYVGNKVPALGSTYTVSFVVPQGVNPVADMPCNATGITLPTAGTPAAEYEFVGWATESIAKTETAPTLYTGNYVAEEDTTLYAVYAVSVGGSGNWTMITNAGDLEADMQVVIVALSANYALSTNQKSNNRGAAAVTKSGNTITFGDDVQLLTLEAGTSAGSFAFHASTGYLYAASTSSNHLKTKTTKDASGSFSITIAANGSATVQSVGNTTKGLLRYNPNNGTPLFSCYGSGQQDIALYAVMGKTVYVSNPTVCAHESTVDVEAQDATCEEPGYTAGVYCEDCDTYIEGYEYIAPLGHDYEGVVTEPTITEGGYTTYTCNNCGDTYIDDETDPIGITYTISFVVPNGVDAVESMGCANAGIKLPTAGVPEEKYTFVGWAEAPVEETEAMPTVYGANTKFYNNGANQTLYAVYSYMEGGSGATGDFTKVTDAAQLKAGSKVIIAAAGYDFAISKTQNGNNRAQAAITKSGDVLTNIGSDVAIFTLQAGTSGGWAFWDDAYTENGYLYAASTSSNYLRTGSMGANACWEITLDGTGIAAVASIGNTSRGIMRYNSKNNPPIFSCYGSGQDDIALYLQAAGGTMYYTSLVGEVENTAAVGDGEATYETLEDAIANTGMEYLFLLDNLEEDVNVDCDLYLDLNGHELVGDITIEDGCTLYLFDSATANYTAGSRGAVMGTIEGNVARSFNTPASYGHNYKYMVIQEEDTMWTSHRYYLAVKSLMLSPCETDNGVTGTALNYKTVLRTNEVAKNFIEGYGAKITGESTVYANSLDTDFVLSATGDNTVTTNLTNTMRSDLTDEENALRGETAVTASAYLKLTDGTEITSAPVEKSLKDVVEAVYGSYALTAHQRVALLLMQRVFGVAMENWELVGPAPAGTEMTVEEIIAIGSSMANDTYTADKYKVTGMITEVYNTQYGNMKITDGNGNILTIYGTYSADGSARYDAMEVKPVAGDTVTILGIVGQHNGTAQIKNGWIVDHIPGEGSDEPATELTIKEAIDMGAAMEHNVYTIEKYLVTGVITQVYNTTHGNMYITDEAGNILTIYGTYSADGSARYDAMEVKPVAGDTVTILGIVGQYNGTPQIKNGWIVAHIPGEGGETPDTPDTPDVPTGDYVTEIQAGTAYKWGISQENLNKVLYFAGTMNGYYGATTEKYEEAVDVTLEATTDGYYVTFQDASGAKKYINVVVSGTHKNFTIADAASTVYTFNEEYDTLNTDVDGTACYIGTYGTYNTFSVSDMSKISTSFPSHFYLEAPEGGETPDTPETPDVPAVEAVAPVEGVAYNFGMIQEAVSTTDIYYLSGGLNGYYMNTSKDAASALKVYVEVTDGGYYLYYMDGDTKTYINMVVSGTHVNGEYSTTASTVYTYDADTMTLIAETSNGTYRFGTRNDKTYTTVGPVDVTKGNFYCKFYPAA